MSRTLFCALVVSVLSLAVLGCGGLPKLEDNPDCATSIEGVLKTTPVWTGEKPVMLIRQLGKVERWTGRVVDEQDDGVIFDRDRISPTSDPEPKFFKYKDIVAIVDERGRVVYGKAPDLREWGLELQLKQTDVADAKTITLKIKPNEAFGYCVPAGEYEVTRVRFIAGNNTIDRGVDLPRMRLTVHENAANYLGDIYIDHSTRDNMEADLILVPCKAEKRPGYSGAGGGLIPFLMDEAHEASLRPVHELRIQPDPRYTYVGRSGHKYSPIRVVGR